jgi:hypothetical protein
MSRVLDTRPMPTKPAKKAKGWFRKARLKRAPLRRVGKKLGKSLQIYHRATKPLWLAIHPQCQFSMIPGASCGSRWNVDVHHKMRRGKYLNDFRYLVTLCREHHDWVESNKKRARQMKLILYK